MREVKTIVLLHCSASSGAQWRDIEAALAGRFRVIAPDLPDGGRTPVGLGEHVRFVRELIGPDAPACIVGHSFGGAVALRLALEAPALARRLVLIEPVAFHLLREDDADRDHYAEIRQVAADVFDGALRGRAEAGMARFVDYWSGSGAWARLAPDNQARLARRIASVADNFTALFADATPLARYRAVAVPALVLRGAASPGPARRVAALLAEALPLAVLRTVSGAGHMLPMTHAAVALRAITGAPLADEREDGTLPRVA